VFIKLRIKIIIMNLKIKALSVFAAFALVLGATTTASALTTSELIDLLVSMGIIPADQASVAQAAVGGSSSSDSCTLKTAPDMTIGAQGANVTDLQMFLADGGYLVMPAGVSYGYFGSLTASALASYQAAMGISPAAGYFGPVTKASISCAPATETETGSTGGSASLSGGEASLEDYDISSGDEDEVEEGASAEVAEIEFDVEDADAMIDRVDLKFANASTTDSTDVWDALESVQLLIDGKEVASANLDDEDDYLDEDEGTIRLSNIDYTVEEGETVTIVVEVTAQDNIDSDDLDTFLVSVDQDGIRATDGEGIQQYLVTSSESSETVSFDVVEEGDGEELNVSSSSNDPDSETLKVEDDKKSDWYEIFAFDVEAEESDIEFDKVTLKLTSDVAVADVIDDLELSIDGENFDDWSIASTTALVTTVEFDIDGDFTLDADDEIEVVLSAKFKSANGSNYSSGATIKAQIEDEAIEAEGADDLVSDGTAMGEEHTLVTEGIVVPKSGFSDEGSVKSNDDGTIVEFTFEFQVSAFEDDFYVATSSVTTFVEGAGAASSSVTVDSTGDEDTTGVFTVEEGETETFTVTVVLSSAVSGQYRVGLDNVKYTTNTDGVSSLQTREVENSDFRTKYSQVN
jgi:peptidoglycan hydrolase-like protein with peptidoglycan-binding domain